MGSFDETSYSSNEMTIIYYSIFVCAILSIIGSTFILFLSFFYPKLRQLPFRLILYLTIADLGMSISYLLPYSASDSVCQAQGYMESYFSLSSIFWSACISHAIKSTILLDKEVKDFMRRYFFICYFLPLLSYLVLIDIKRYRVALGWCWIYLNETHHSMFYRQITYRLITYYIPLAVVIIYIIFNYLSVISAIKKSESFFGKDSKVREAMILKLKLYPLILIVSVFPVCVLRFLSIFITPSWSLTLISGVFMALGGFLNSIVYGFTQDVRNELKKTLGLKKRDYSESLTEI
jgi:hypothetical protein